MIMIKVLWKHEKSKFLGIVENKNALTLQSDEYVYPVGPAKELFKRYNKVELNKLLTAIQSRKKK